MLLQKNKRQFTTCLLFLIYLGYFVVVSLFVHMHVYHGVIYIHSHPYQKSQDTSNKTPLETHQHTAASFFTTNQLSNITSGEAHPQNLTDIILITTTIFYQEYVVSPSIITTQRLFHLRAPPLT